jgi:hypothetical protein
MRGLVDMPPVTVGGVEYTGAYLALMVAVNGNQPEAEAERTPELVLGLTRAVAKAQREMENAKVDYRHWRDTQIHTLTNSLSAACAAGFECAVNPGKDSKGKEKAPKCPSASAAETYIRSVEPYKLHWEIQNHKEEAWAVMHGALEASRLRIWCLREIVRDNFAPNPTIHSESQTDSDVRRTPPPPPLPRR